MSEDKAGKKPRARFIVGDHPRPKVRAAGMALCWGSAIQQPPIPDCSPVRTFFSSKIQQWVNNECANAHKECKIEISTVQSCILKSDGKKKYCIYKLCWLIHNFWHPTPFSLFQLRCREKFIISRCSQSFNSITLTSQIKCNIIEQGITLTLQCVLLELDATEF